MSDISYDKPTWWQRAIRRVGATGPGTWLFSRLLHRLDAPVLRASDGRYSLTSLVGGLPIIALTTTGAKSGEPRTVPLIAIPDNGRLILIASNWGRGRRPAWYYNLCAHPEATVTHDGETTRWRAEELTGDEREAAWQKAVAAYVGYARYAAMHPEQTIPVLALKQIELSSEE